MSQEPDRRLTSAVRRIACAAAVVVIECTSRPLQTPAGGDRIAWIERCNKFVVVVVCAWRGAASAPRGLPGWRDGGMAGLMIEARDRTKQAFQRVAAAELPALYGLARRLVGDDAEDLVQEALLHAYRSFGSLKHDSAAGSWLKRILVNVFRDQLRRRTRSVQELPIPMDQPDDFSLYRTLVEQDPLPYSDTLHHDYLEAFGNQDVREVLMRLPELYRAPLVLRYMDGFATKEIARMLEVPLGTVLARLHRGRKRFERELWAYAQETGLLLKGVVG
jgi:RNA polymerase sigma-70 factor (ECF subfamily)